MKKLSVPMTRAEWVTGIFYILFQMLVLPILVMLADALFALNLNEAELNFVCFAINFIAVTVIFREYLFASAKVFFADPQKTLRSCGWGFLLHFGGTYVVTLLIVILEPGFANANDTSISGMVAQNMVLMAIGTIILAPVVEEILFRGVVFGMLYRKWPIAAYILSAAIFASLHVLNYIGMYSPLRLVLCFLQYLPASIALAWLYVRADTIFAPIILHVTINAIGILAM